MIHYDTESVAPFICSGLDTVEPMSRSVQPWLSSKTKTSAPELANSLASHLPA